MGQRIGAYRQLVPVTSKPNVPRDDTPVPEDNEPGVTWATTAKFKYSTLEVDPLPAGVGFGGSATVTHAPQIRFETRVESFPSASMWITEDYKYRFHTNGFGVDDVDEMHIGEVWSEAWYFLGEEDQNEIVGFTFTRYGVTERYRTRPVEYWLHLTFKNSVVNRQGTFNKYGELPP